MKKAGQGRHTLGIRPMYHRLRVLIMVNTLGNHCGIMSLRILAIDGLLRLIARRYRILRLKNSGGLICWLHSEGCNGILGLLYEGRFLTRFLIENSLHLHVIWKF
eukprot:XP_001708552.1 Hypothetical protein GL50803_32369 [Giardia lamblia ATCC 50803]